MNRRRYLLAAGSGIVPLVSGCLGTDDGGGTDNGGTGDPDGSPTPSASPTPDGPVYHDPGETASTGIGEVTVEGVSVQKSVLDRGVFRVLRRKEGVQYVLVEAGDEPPHFVPVFDGEPGEPEAQWRPTGPDTAYLLGVDVERAATAAIALQEDTDVRWELPASALERLANRPEIRVLDAAVVARDGESALSLTLENTGDRDGVFRGIVLSPVGADIDDEVRIEVPQGETVTETVQNSVIEDWGTEYELGEVDPDRRTFGEGG